MLIEARGKLHLAGQELGQYQQELVQCQQELVQCQQELGQCQQEHEAAMQRIKELEEDDGEGADDAGEVDGADLAEVNQ